MIGQDVMATSGPGQSKGGMDNKATNNEIAAIIEMFFIDTR